MKGMIDMKFSEKQIEFMKNIGVSVNFDTDISDEEYEVLEDKVTEYLQKQGFITDYSVTEHGKMCESILDRI